MPRPTFPRSLFELHKRFPDEEACRQYLADSRWPDGFQCPRCKGSSGLELPSRLLWRCGGCRLDTSLTAGTVLHGTRTPLTHWFWAAYLVATHTPGLSAVQLQRQLGLARYETAWLMLHKLRSAMVRPARDRLTGVVEVDEAYLGGFISGSHGGRTFTNKTVVAAAVKVRGEGSGRVRLPIVPDASQHSLLPFIKATVEAGSTVRTDGWTGYKHVTAAGYRHDRRVQGTPDRAGVILPRPTWTSTSSASTAGGPRWLHSSRSLVSAPSTPARPTGRSWASPDRPKWSEPDRHTAAIERASGRYFTALSGGSPAETISSGTGPSGCSMT